VACSQEILLHLADQDVGPRTLQLVKDNKALLPVTSRIKEAEEPLEEKGVVLAQHFANGARGRRSSCGNGSI
jgi:hypothetical protein